ncbi:hypothetical protein C6B38_06105 [Spiroplasma sp. ChiS]|uniref:hypothetical protein n=1 Tax=Spiroplasma sp. ChiS TaxID=2099885 RepID=UPI000CF90FEE|nr:hypothetical protein [Spiroplasma sp. ChiS]PQP78421.1 hypothetical protein C6B38_06105 [Spiroplasma sp. ChiS]
MILITSTNPDSIYQDHIDYLNKLMPFNRKELESNGEQISKLIVPVLDPKTGQKAYDKKVINHYTNYLINKDVETTYILYIWFLLLIRLQKILKLKSKRINYSA